MRDAYPDRPRRPLRETVCEIDRDIIRLVMRRHNIIHKMAGGKERLSAQEEKFLREHWEAQAAKVSNDPRLSSSLFSLLREIGFLPRPDEGAQEKRPAFGLAPTQQPVKLSMVAPFDSIETRVFSYLAAASGSKMNIHPALVNDDVADCVKMFKQAGAELVRDPDRVLCNASEPLGVPDKVLHAGESRLNFYLALAHYLGHPSRAKFSGSQNLQGESLASVRRFLPEIGARMIGIIPKNDGLPVRLESSGMLPELIVFPEDIPWEMPFCMLLAAPSYDSSVTFSLEKHPQAAKILSLALPPLKEAEASISIDGEKIHIQPTPIKIPSAPKLHMDTAPATFLLALAPALSGEVVLKGSWKNAPEGKAILSLFEEAQIRPEIKADEVRLSCSKEFSVPEGGFKVDGEFADILLPLAMAFSCIKALRSDSSQMPVGYVPGGSGWTIAESFLHACGLDSDENGQIKAAQPKQDEDANLLPAWTAPSPFWAAALALASCARKKSGAGFKLNNPSIMMKLYPGFWSIFNTLPEPKIQGKTVSQTIGRRVRTNELAHLTPKSED